MSLEILPGVGEDITVDARSGRHLGMAESDSGHDLAVEVVLAAERAMRQFNDERQ
jgi:hypothetical protein